LAIAIRQREQWWHARERRLIGPVRTFPAMAGDRFFLLAIAGFSAAPAFQSARRAGGGELPEENEIARLPDPAF
jgi:hypothetical protein